MPSLTTHLQQAELNEEAALYNRQKYPHVAIIMCFYAALHYVETHAVWHRKDIYKLYCEEKLTQHERYQSYIDDINFNGSDDLSVAYKLLREGSEIARYLKSIKQSNKTSGQYFKLGADFYFKKLQILKDGLQISSIKASIKKT